MISDSLEGTSVSDISCVISVKIYVIFAFESGKTCSGSGFRSRRKMNKIGPFPCHLHALHVASYLYPYCCRVCFFVDKKNIYIILSNDH